MGVSGAVVVDKDIVGGTFIFKGEAAPIKLIEADKLKKKPSDFRGALKLTTAQYEDIQSDINDIRNEWDRDV